ncbi:AP-3 complex subunit sigma-1 [Porphyridium purpureum]|uniref:AP complex subunit sigma n=1 Tax=Porphyridium purpureum TaxID=35688 RepID=A0A5J4Z0N9_PORPP|nr:AP-3 complex subunit sigma-1 [Porphyridium purpureum]|eukprot:POR2808..scf208_2
MISSVVVFNNYGKPRLTKFYVYASEDQQQKYVAECFRLISKRSDEQCNFMEIRADMTGSGTKAGSRSRRKIVFRCYATLYFVFCIDESESELGILDLIQVFVETLDRVFENVCELDLIFHVDRVNYVLDEFVVGGLVVETNTRDVLTMLQLQKTEEVSVSSSKWPSSISSMIQ